MTIQIELLHRLLSQFPGFKLMIDLIFSISPFFQNGSCRCILKEKGVGATAFLSIPSIILRSSWPYGFKNLSR